MKQPTIEEIKSAWNEFFQVIDIAGARSDALRNLIDLRKAKTTWIGAEENDFMFKINQFLDEWCAGWRGV